MLRIKNLDKIVFFYIMPNFVTERKINKNAPTKGP